MYSGEAIGRRKSVRKRHKERARSFAASTEPKPSRGRAIARVSAVLVVIAAVGASIPEAYSGLQGSDLFKLQEISVVGSDLITAEDIVIRSGLTQGTNLFEANLKSATDSIVAHPLVRSALLLRRPPDSLVISVEERVPIALVSTSEGLVGFDRDATSFEVPNVPFDLPIVTGLHTVLENSTLSEFKVRHTLARFIETAQSEEPEFWSRVSEVCLETSEEGDLILENGMTLKIKLDGISNQIQNYRAFMASGDVLPQDLAYIDLRYENQVVAGRLRADSTFVGLSATPVGIPD
jgi:cell division protein FtsQ